MRNSQQKCDNFFVWVFLTPQPPSVAQPEGLPTAFLFGQICCQEFSAFICESWNSFIFVRCADIMLVSSAFCFRHFHCLPVVFWFPIRKWYECFWEPPFVETCYSLAALQWYIKSIDGNPHTGFVRCGIFDSSTVQPLVCFSWFPLWQGLTLAQAVPELLGILLPQAPECWHCTPVAL